MKLYPVKDICLATVIVIVVVFGSDIITYFGGLV